MTNEEIQENRNKAEKLFKRTTTNSCVVMPIILGIQIIFMIVALCVDDKMLAIAFSYMAFVCPLVIIGLLCWNLYIQRVLIRRLNKEISEKFWPPDIDDFFNELRNNVKKIEEEYR